MGSSAPVTRQGLYWKAVGMLIFAVVIKQTLGSEAFCEKPHIPNGDAGPPLGPANATFEDGEIIEVHCEVNHRLECMDSEACERSRITCKEGNWSTLPKCIPMEYCKLWNVIENGHVDQPKRAAPYTIARFSCSPGYKLIGNQATMCTSTDDRYWIWNITKMPSCVKEQTHDSCSTNYKHILIAVFVTAIITSLVTFIMCRTQLIKQCRRSIYEKFRNLAEMTLLKKTYLPVRTSEC